MSEEVKLRLNSNFLKDYGKKIILIIIACLFSSIAVNVFFVPTKMLSGGISGISILIQYLTDGRVPSGVSLFLINIPVFLFAFKRIDREFAILSFIAMLVLSFTLTVTRGLTKYILVDDILLGAVFGGILNGIGMGILFRNKSSQGGLDVLSVIIRRKYNINIGTGLMFLNTFVILFSSLLFGYKPALYTLIQLFIGYTVLDKVRTGFNVKKNVIIISDSPDIISKRILTELGRGVTFLEGEGAFSHQEKKVIYTILTSIELAKLKEIVHETDPLAFIAVNEVVEVVGRGFKDTEI